MSESTIRKIINRTWATLYRRHGQEAKLPKQSIILRERRSTCIESCFSPRAVAPGLQCTLPAFRPTTDRWILVHAMGFIPFTAFSFYTNKNQECCMFYFFVIRTIGTEFLLIHKLIVVVAIKSYLLWGTLCCVSIILNPELETEIRSMLVLSAFLLTRKNCVCFFVN